MTTAQPVSGPDPGPVPGPGLRPRRAVRAWAAALTLTLGVLLLVVAPPWLPTAAAEAVHQAFAPLCHQMSSRSFHVHGVAFAACHRCTGIYAGLVLGVLAWPLLRTWVERAMAPRVALALALAAAPLGVDWALGFFGVWPNTTLTQTATGALFGAASGLLLARGFGLDRGQQGARAAAMS